MLRRRYEDGPYITKNDRIVELEGQNKIQEEQISMLIEESANRKFHERKQRYDIISKENTNLKEGVFRINFIHKKERLKDLIKSSSR